ASPTSPTSTLALHDALPIFANGDPGPAQPRAFQVEEQPDHGHEARQREVVEPAIVEAPVGIQAEPVQRRRRHGVEPASAGRDLLDRKSTRLNSSHVKISYAV